MHKKGKRKDFKIFEQDVEYIANYSLAISSNIYFSM